MARKIVVTSGKGGVGKTTVAVYLSAWLAKKGERVVLCDADFGLNNVDLTAGVESLITYDIVDVIEGRCRAKQALVKHPLYGNLFLLTSSNSAPERYVSPQAVKVVLDALAPQFDFIIIDCPAGIDDGFHRAVATADEALVITTPHLSALRDADKAVTILKSYRLNSLSVVVNKVRGDLLSVGKCLTPKDVEELLKVPVVGILPENDGIEFGDLSQIPAPFRVLGNNLLTGKRRLYDVTRKYCGFFGNIRRALKRNL
ncbi:MAG: septum site-determining protein MinD [Clostridia bacterium]|nr:septum site-determining protein MinD [Clostridia bacterium]